MVRAKGTNGHSGGSSVNRLISGLVPYDEDSDSDSGPSHVGNGTSPLKPPPPKKSNPQLSMPTFPFMPRSVVLKNANSNGGNSLNPPTVNRPATPMLGSAASGATPPQSLSSSTGEPKATNSSSGAWKVSDSECHNPSVHSDNSTGSTSSGWRVSSRPGSSQEVRKEPSANPTPVIPANTLLANASNDFNKTKVQPPSPSRLQNGSSGDGGSNGYHKQDTLKRRSSIEEYESELDRGRTKKVKQRHHGEQDQYRRPSFNSNNGFNPFQNYQQGGSNSGTPKGTNGGNKSGYDHQDRRSSSGGKSWGGRGGSWKGYHSGKSRDHSYHSGDRRSQSSGGGGGLSNKQRSYSSGSLNSSNGSGDSYHRDRNYKRDDRRFSNGRNNRDFSHHYNRGNR